MTKSERRQQKIEQGKCTSCGAPAQSDKTYCENCLLKKIKNRIARENRYKMSGKCTRCAASNVEIVRNDYICINCWFKKIAQQNLGDNSYLEIIVDLWNQQNGLCRYSQEKLIPGINASLDHKMPRSKGGNNDKDNLQWITKEWNTIKWDKSESELFTFIKQVYQNIVNLENNEQGKHPYG